MIARLPLDNMVRRLRPALGLGLLWVAVAAGAETARVPAAEQQPGDVRLGPLVNLNGYFPFCPCASKQAWAERAEQLQRQLLVATGLWPMPTKTPPAAVIHGRVDRDDYTVERVFFQSFPGHFVTGSLYRPKGRTGKLPGVLCPHGHWPNGRFFDHGEKKVLQEIVAGAERFRVGGRYPLQARCVQLARMGCVVFHYDMVGYADSIQLAHRPGLRVAMNTPENWGYFSPQAELRLQTMMGLQTYNSIRALDWLSQLPDVDPQRIGVTGASGGGTQTFILCAIDPRPAVAVPAVMVGTAMQGGCTCENCCYLRVGTGNVEIAALIAPRPLGMTAADDWTKEIATKGLPELKQHYRMLGAEKLVTAWPLLHFPHNYNYVSREVMYHWMNKHLKLGLAEPIVEEDFRPLSVDELTVWDGAHPKPPQGDDYERSLLRWITEDSNRQIQALVPQNAAGLAKYRQVVGGAVDVLIGRRVPKQADVQQRPAAAIIESHVVRGMGATGCLPASARSARADKPPVAPDCSSLNPKLNKDVAAVAGGAAQVVPLLLRHESAKEEVPALLAKPQPWNKHLVIWVSKDGKRSLFDAAGQLQKPVQRLLKGGAAVLAVDLLGQGEHAADGRPMAKNRLNANGRNDWASYAGYTYGYNYPLFAQRVHDLLLAVAFARHRLGAERVGLIGLDGAGHWAAAARAQAGAAIDRAAIDTAGFRFAAITTLDDADFLPGAAKYLDLPGMLSLSAPHPLWLAGEGTTAPLPLAAAYQAAGKPAALTISSAPAKDREVAAVEWVLHQPD